MQELKEVKVKINYFVFKVLCKLKVFGPCVVILVAKGEGE